MQDRKLRIVDGAELARRTLTRLREDGHLPEGEWVDEVAQRLGQDSELSYVMGMASGISQGLEVAGHLLRQGRESLHRDVQDPAARMIAVMTMEKAEKVIAEHRRQQDAEIAAAQLANRSMDDVPMRERDPEPDADV